MLKSAVTNNLKRLFFYIICCLPFYSICAAENNVSPAIDIALRKTAYDVLYGDVIESDRIFLKSLHNQFDNILIDNAEDKTVTEILNVCALHFEGGQPLPDLQTQNYLTELKKLWSSEYGLTVDEDDQDFWLQKPGINRIKIPFCILEPERDLILHKVRKDETYSDFYASSYRNAHDDTFYRLTAVKGNYKLGNYEAEILHILNNRDLNFPISQERYSEVTRVLESYSKYYRDRKIYNSSGHLQAYLDCVVQRSIQCDFAGELLSKGPWDGNVNIIHARVPRFVYAKPLDETIVSKIANRDDLFIYKSGKEMITSGVSGCNYDKSSETKALKIAEILDKNSFVLEKILDRRNISSNVVDIYVIDIGFSNAFAEIESELSNLKYVKATEEYLSLSTPGHGSAVSLIAAGGLNFVTAKNEALLERVRIVQKSLSSYPERYVQLNGIITGAHSANQFSVVNMSFEEVDSRWSDGETEVGYFTTDDTENALYVFAAGNHGDTYNASSSKHLSKKFPPNQVLLVGALSDDNSSRGINSSKGNLVRVYAPGCVKSVWDGNIKAHWGTSFAAPKFSFTASIVGGELIRNKKRFLPFDVIDQVLSTADVNFGISDRQFESGNVDGGYALVLDEVAAANVFLDRVVFDSLNEKETNTFFGHVVGIFEYDDDAPLVDLVSGEVNVTHQGKILLDVMERQFIRKVQDFNKTVPFYEASVSCKKVDKYLLSDERIKGIRQIKMSPDLEVAYLASKRDYRQTDTFGFGDPFTEVHLFPVCLDWVSSENSFVAIYTEKQLAAGKTELTLIPTRSITKINFASYKFSAYKDSLN